MSETILLENDTQGVATVTLNRADIHNAFDDALIQRLDAVIDQLTLDDSVRAIILTGSGKSFSAGADMNWMQRMVEANEEENKADSLLLAQMLRKLNFCPKPTVARIQGAAYGGGVGLVACCDVAIASEAAEFGLTEVNLGLVPAVISPYVIEAIGSRNARKLFLTGERFTASTAMQMGLVHQVCAAQDIDTEVAQTVRNLLKAGPKAQVAAKQLVGAIAGRTAEGQQQLDQATANLIARLRISDEGQEGLRAFLEKRKPDWIPHDS